MKLTNFFNKELLEEGYSYMSKSNPQPQQDIVDKFAGVSDSQRSYYIYHWAKDKGMDTDEAMFKAGYVQDGYLGAGAWNWRYVGMGESVQETVPYSKSTEKDLADKIGKASDKKKLKQAQKKSLANYKKKMKANDDWKDTVEEAGEDDDYEKAYDFEPTPEAEAWYDSIVDHDDLDNMYNQWEKAFSQADTEDKVDVALQHVQVLLADGPLDDYNTLWQAWEQDEDIKNMLPKYQAMAKKSAGTSELPMMGEADDDVDTGPTWKDDLEAALDGYPEWAHEYIKDGVCPECGGNGYMDGDYENEDGEENDECNGMYDYDCDEGEIRDNTWADELKSKEPEAPKQPAPSKEQIMKILPRLHDDYVKTGRYNAFELGGILRQMYPELNKREAGSYVADFFKTFEEDIDEVAGAKDCWDGYKKDGTQPGTGKNKGKRVNKCVKEDDLDEKGPNYDASDIHRGDAITCKPCGGKGCDHCDYKGVHAKDERTQESAPVEFDNDSNEAHVSKMLAKALGDDNKWSEMSAPELYAELESTNPEVADMLHKVAMTIYDVKLKERAYKDVGVADVQKDPRGKEFKFDKGSKKFKSQDGEEADVTTKLGKDLMRLRKNHMKRTSPSYPKNKR